MCHFVLDMMDNEALQLVPFLLGFPSLEKENNKTIINFTFPKKQFYETEQIALFQLLVFGIDFEMVKIPSTVLKITLKNVHIGSKI